MESKLVPGSGGIFEVLANGEDVFNKKITGRFPEEGEVTKALSD